MAHWCTLIATSELTDLFSRAFIVDAHQAILTFLARDPSVKIASTSTPWQGQLENLGIILVIGKWGIR